MSLLEVSDLHAWFSTDRGVVRAVDGVSLDVERGRTLGIVGESGSGKSALLRSIMGLHTRPPSARYDGRVMLDGTDVRALGPRRLESLWGSRFGIVLQDPLTSLNPVVRIGRQLTETLERHLDLSPGQARRRALELLEEVGIPDPQQRLGQYPHQLSGGMRQRVTIAIALSCEPDILLADEPTTALDVTVQAQILALLQRLQRERGMAMIFVTHDLGVVAGLAHEIGVMYAGRLVELGAAEQVVSRPAMPYTEALLRSSPRLELPSQTELPAIPGRPPSLTEELHGCPFVPRCAYAQERCGTGRPELLSVGESSQRAACFFPLRQLGAAG